MGREAAASMIACASACTAGSAPTQAAVLMEKLKIFPEEILARERIARRYSAGLADVATIPKLAQGSTSVWAQYTIRLAPGRRDALAAALKSQGIPTAIHYPTPLHRQQPYQRFPIAAGGAPVSERLAEEVISLPMPAYLDAMTQDRIIAAVRRALGGGGRPNPSHLIFLVRAALQGRTTIIGPRFS